MQLIKKTFQEATESAWHVAQSNPKATILAGAVALSLMAGHTGYDIAKHQEDRVVFYDPATWVVAPASQLVNEINVGSTTQQEPSPASIDIHPR